MGAASYPQIIIEVALIDAEFGEAILNCPEIVGEPSRAARNLSSWASRCSGAASSDKGDPLRTDMFGMHLASGDRATVTDMERFRFAATGDGDPSANHHDACVPRMRVVGVHLARFQAAIEDLVTLAPEVGFEIALVHDKGSDR